MTTTTTFALLCAAVALVGCGSTQMQAGEKKADAPAPRSTAGMDAAGNVTDPRKVEAGSGQKVKGMGDWEGEITGRPAPGGKFGQLQIGMTATQVISMLGQPSDQGTFITGKALIPFYFGSDRYRYEVVYKSQGRLIFASSSTYTFGDMHLIWIIHSAAEPGTR